MKTARLVTSLAAVAAALILVGGCGSSTNAALGEDSRAEVMAISRDIRDLHVVVSPREGAVDAPAACSDTATGFGCDRVLDADSTTLSFDTDNSASTQPYHVYVSNTAAVTRTVTVQVRMDGDLKVNEAFDIPAGGTVRVARIYRNSADPR